MPKSRAKKILLLDDDALRRSTRAVILLTHGYDVESVATMSDALRVCGADEPDLLLIGVTQRMTPRSWLDRIGKSHPRQRVGFLLNEGEKLCSVQFEGELLMAEEGPADLVSRVAMLLNRESQQCSPFVVAGCGSN
jgi:CheY-like chemotaxis protein